ncbi:MAG: tetratricopeptide repeat protein [Dehalococcoidia bacterium]|nr:tetratricopeptide repeat protein [Dehalococcoidia bacterium]
MMLEQTAYRPRGASMGGPGADRKKTNLGKEAVKAALKGEWERAAELNRAVLELNPNDCEASNRLAKALMELGDYTEARQILETLRVRAPSNNIARKNLARLEQLQTCGGDIRRSATGDNGLPGMFIAESGKSCTTVLRKPAGASATATATVRAGDVVALNPCGEGVAVTARDGGYLGTVERRLGRRLHKLMAAGNQYAAAVVGTDAEGISVILRETRQHPTLRHVVSFPSAPDSVRHPTAMIADTVLEETDDEPEAIPEDPGDVVDGVVASDESGVIALAEEAADDTDDSDVPVLDDDVDTDGWTPVTPAADNEDDWE